MRYLIGDLLVNMDYGGMAVTQGPNLQKFRFDGNWNGETINFHADFGKLECDKNKIFKSDNYVYEIYNDNNSSMLVYHWGNLLHAFAVYPQQFSVTYNPEMKNQPPLGEDWFFSVTSFHRQLLMHDAAVLHASYININGKAVLFTGPSGIGKSTQAVLWQQFANAEIINGDRTLVRCKDGKWLAFGYPCSGTSGICLNKTLPLKAIVVLQKSNENKIEELSAVKKIQALISATELYPWDKTELDMAFSTAEKLIGQIPVIKLCCRADNDAVNLLKAYLEENTL